MVHQKLCHGTISETKDLRKASVSQWVAGHSGLTEVRDLREATTLGYVMDLINSKDLAMAMDVLGQRLVAIQKKSSGTDWKKEEQVELAMSGASQLPAGMLKLTQ